jgi:glycosyltransferase involved in cell wall biosynthesis
VTSLAHSDCGQEETTAPSKALRVALVTPPLDASGGIGRVMSYALGELKATNVTVHVLDTRGHNAKPTLSLFTLAAVCVRLVLLKLLDRVDVAHVNISAHGSSVRKPIVVWLCRLLRIPVILHLHASSYPEFFDALPSPAKSVLQKTFSSAETVIVLGRVWATYVMTTLRVDPRRIVVLPNAVPGPAEAHIRRRAPGTPLRIVFLGRLGERKGVRDLFEALADPEVRTQSWRVTIAGDGDIERYRAEAERLGLASRVRFPGWVDETGVTRILKDGHALVLPSRAEGMPMSVLEAFAHGVPAVATRVGAIPEVITDGASGILFPVGDVKELRAALLSLLKDEDKRLLLAFGARKAWEERFAIAPFATELLQQWRIAAGSTLRRPTVAEKA